MYTAEEFIAKAEAGEFRLETGGHRLGTRRLDVFQKEFFADLCEKLRWNLTYYEERLAEEAASGGDYSRQELDLMRSKEFAKVGAIPRALANGQKCSLCDEQLWPYLKSADTVALGGWRFAGAELLGIESHCRYEDGVRPIVTRINVPSGRFLFANYFIAPGASDDYLFPDAPPEMEYDKAYNICTPRGREGVAQHLAQQNVLNCHTGNMTVYLYKHPERDEILVLGREREVLEQDIACNRGLLAKGGLSAEDAARAEKNIVADLKKLEAIAGYRQLGEICTPVWKFQGADRAVLEAAGFSDQKLKDMDSVEVELKPGTWEVTDLFHSDDYQGVMLTMRRVG